MSQWLLIGMVSTISCIEPLSSKKLCSGCVCDEIFLKCFCSQITLPITRCPIKSNHGEPVHNACFNWNITLTLFTGILVNGQYLTPCSDASEKYLKEMFTLCCAMTEYSNQKYQIEMFILSYTGPYALITTAVSAELGQHPSLR